MNKLVEQFIALVNSNTSLISTDKGLFNELIETELKDLKTLNTLFSFVLENKIVNEEIVKDLTVFDYFYEKSLIMTEHHLEVAWLKNFFVLVKSLPVDSHIKENDYYIFKLQRSAISYNEIFKMLFESDFNVGDPEDLIYTVIARGETIKIKTISDMYIIEDYLCIFDVAVRHGRSEIIEYFIKNLDLNTELFGKVLEFENLKIVSHSEVQNDNIKDYLKSIKLILQDYKYPITLKTINVWCDIINQNLTESKEWYKEVLLILKSKITEKAIFDGAIDFGRFNEVLLNNFSKRDQVSTVSNLASDVVELQDRLTDIQLKYFNLLDKYYVIKDQLDSLK